MKKIFFLSILLMTIFSCSQKKAEETNTLYVPIMPLKAIVEQIAGEGYEVKVLVPKGASPETYELSPKELQELNNAKIVFSTGLLDFEQSLLKKLDRQDRIIDLSTRIETIEGACSHTHHSHCCNHGVDPHIWCSPKQLLIMAEDIYDAIRCKSEDTDSLQLRYQAVAQRLGALDEELQEKFSNLSNRSFVIYHPALTYLARDYSLEQIAVEHEGKEASVKHMTELIDAVRQKGIRYVMYQTEYPASAVKAICSDTEAKAVEIDPLSEDVEAFIRKTADIISNGYEQ
ncbi:MAG: zinc ABC transporter substrate-binding protein [Alistipes sp.]|nr:zinc ABC transporter substrate-binding protein [Candidatus Alistipes equi]